MILRGDFFLATLALAVVSLGTVMVASASVVQGDSFLYKHLLSLGLATLLFFAAAILPSLLWQQLHRLCWVLALLLCIAVLIPGIGREVNGASRWIDLGIGRIHVAEYAKVLMVIYLAGYLARVCQSTPAGSQWAALLPGAARGAAAVGGSRSGGKRKQARTRKQPTMTVLPLEDPWRIMVPVALMAALAVLLLRQPDYGTVVVLGVTTCAMLFVSGVRLRHFLLLTLIGVGLLGLLAVAQPYRLERLTTFFDPWSVAFTSGYQLTQALIAFGRGGYFGLGLGEGIQKLEYLPEAHNDFIFAIVVEELGLVGALLLIGALAMIVLRLLRIGRRAIAQQHLFGGFLVTGIGVLLGAQCLINLGVNTGVLPTKGLTLPFVSYGGHSLLVCCFMLGLSFRVASELEESAHA